MTSRSQALATLKALKPAAVFLQAYETKRLPENLHIYFGPPEELFLPGGTQRAASDESLIPILDDGNFGVVTFYERATGALVQKDIEDPTEITARFQNWQQYLADLVIRIAETVEDDETIRRIARLLEFEYTEETLAFLNETSGDSYEEYQAKEKQFIAEL
jgi:hypothetical protein